jgi:hypothetical protein
MAAPLGLATTNTNASFVFNNLQQIETSSNSGNTNSVLLIPYVQALDFQSASFMAGRQPGGVAFRAASNTVFASASNANAAVIQLDGMVTTASHLGYTKNGAFLVTANGSAVVVPLTNTQTNTNGFAGDTVFATVYEAIIFNLSGLDGNVAVNSTLLTNGTNGCNFLGATSLTVTASSRTCVESVNGTTVNAANANISINAATAANIAVVLMGK